MVVGFVAVEWKEDFGVKLMSVPAPFLRSLASELMTIKQLSVESRICVICVPMLSITYSAGG